MLFNIKQAIRSIISTPFTTMVLILTFAGGFFCIYIATGFTDAFMDDISCYMYGAPEDYYAWVSTNSKFNFDSHSNMDTFNAEALIMASGYYFTGVSDNDYYVSGVQHGFEENFHNKLVDGRYFSLDDFQTQKAVCMVENTLAITNGLSVGDSCDVMGMEFTIIGIIKTNAWSGRYILPIDTVQNIPYSDSYLINYELIVKVPKDNFQLATLINTMTNSRYRIAKEGTSSEIYHSTIIASLGNIAIVIVAALGIFLYAFLNLLGIAEFKRNNKVKEIGIRSAMGAKSKQIYLEIFFEYLLIMLISLLLLFASTPLLIRLINGIISWKFGLTSIIGLLLTAVIFAAIISMAIIEPLCRKNTYSIVDLICERWAVK